MPDQSRVHIRIRGRVQGVGYRVAIQQVALQWGIRGWVRNRGDGSVEALLVGDPTSLEQILEWCGSGPPGADVEGVECQPLQGVSTAEPEGSRFEVRGTVP